VGVVDVTPCGDGAEVTILIIDVYRGRGLGKAVAYDFAGRLKKMGFRYVLRLAGELQGFGHSEEDRRRDKMQRRLRRQIRAGRGRRGDVQKLSLYRGSIVLLMSKGRVYRRTSSSRTAPRLQGGR
jgi:hypothetical protein